MNEHAIPSVVLEDTVAAAESFAAAKRVEDAVRQMATTTPLVFTNFTGSFVTKFPSPVADRNSDSK